MSAGVLFLTIFGTIFTGSMSVIGYVKYRAVKKWYDKLAYIKDCPFKFHQSKDGYKNSIVFELSNAKLYCSFSFGIRSDGIYGLKTLELCNLNGQEDKIRLEIGQSVFPIIEDLDKFAKWADTKTFKWTWNWSFNKAWTDMKQELDNLAYLETKSKEAEETK